MSIKQSLESSVGGLPAPVSSSSVTSNAHEPLPGRSGTGRVDVAFSGGRRARGLDGRFIEEMVAEPTPEELQHFADLEVENNDPLAAVYDGGLVGMLEDAEQAIDEVGAAFDEALEMALGGGSDQAHGYEEAYPNLYANANRGSGGQSSRGGADHRQYDYRNQRGGF